MSLASKRGHRLGWFLIGTLLVVGGVAVARQRIETIRLRTELESARVESDEHARLLAENERLQAKQVPTAELERLRADHAALPRLRTELEALRKKRN